MAVCVCRCWLGISWGDPGWLLAWPDEDAPVQEEVAEMMMQEEMEEEEEKGEPRRNDEEENYKDQGIHSETSLRLSSPQIHEVLQSFFKDGRSVCLKILENARDS